MKTTDAGNRALLRRETLVKRFYDYFKQEQNADSGLFRVKLLKDDDLLSDFDAIELALEKIKGDLGADFKYQIIYREGITDAVAPENRRPYRIPETIKINIEDRKKFNDYYIGLKREASKLEVKYSFTLNEQGELSLNGSKQEPYSIKGDSLRLKLIRLLAKQKKFISARDLAIKFRLDEKDGADRIRKTVGQIRAQVKKKLKVAGSALIQSDKSIAGYRIQNLTIN